MDQATLDLLSEPCPGCGCEPEVIMYWKRNGKRVGYTCACGWRVIDGQVVMMGEWS